MIENELKIWLKSQQPKIEKIILDAAFLYVKKHEELPNFGHDLRHSQIEAYNLNNGQDLCYDRFTTSLAYSLWYQARRINVFISHFYKKILEAYHSTQPVDIFDLGAGTGCVQFCFGLSYVFYFRKFKSPFLFRLINIDVSPFMLDYLRSYLWPMAVEHYPELKNLPIEYHVYSWSNKSDLQVTNPWICASYLFDSSDNEEYLVANFKDLINAFAPQKIMLLTSAQAQKQNLMTILAKEMREKKYQPMQAHPSHNIFNGSLVEVTNFRKSLIEKYNLKASLYPVTWVDKSFNVIGFEKIQLGLNYDIGEIPQHLELFNPPLRIRKDVQLNDEQKVASSFEERPSIITGPAGCGKSVVVTEKIINILEYYKWSKNLIFLVTTFNKGLIKQLRAWITDLLVLKGINHKQFFYFISNGVDDGTGEITIQSPYVIKIKFVHFEMLGKYVGRISYEPYSEETHIIKLKEIISDVRKQLNVLSDDMVDILTPEFLLEEYHRVIYGLSCPLNKGEEVYQLLERKGRGKKPQLQYNSPRRKAIWLSLYKYARWMYENPNAGKSFIARRQLFLNLLDSGEFKDKFDYVFVDEFQDCTAADYKIMGLMLHDVNNLVLAGDLAQAVHIGQAGTIPRDGDMTRRKYHKLKGSYRLPYRISEAIAPLSQQITNDSGDRDTTVEITPYKGAPPGARPIIVYADDEEGLSKKIVSIKKCYSLFEATRITILEKDDLLCRAIARERQPVETTTILRLKGLEKDFIVWSLQAEIQFENEVKEFAYTIMTRTNCMLIIGITKNVRHSHLEILTLLRSNRIILWDEQTHKFMMESNAIRDNDYFVP